MNNTYKPIKRAVYDFESKSVSIEKFEFIAEGQWANGNLAYTKLDDIKEGNEDEYCMYEQIILNHQLVMVRI